MYKNEANLQYNEEKYPPDKMRNIFNEYKKRWIPIVETTISQNPGDSKHFRSDYKEFMLKEAPEKLCDSVYLRTKSYFIDFFHNGTSDFWEDSLERMYNKMPFGGLWLDANEVTTWETNKNDVTVIVRIKTYS